MKKRKGLLFWGVILVVLVVFTSTALVFAAQDVYNITINAGDSGYATDGNTTGSSINALVSAGENISESYRVIADAGWSLDGFTYNEVLQVCNGDNFALVLKSDGSVWGAGYNYYGQLGVTGSSQETINEFTMSNITTGAKALDVGYCHAVVLKEDGSVWVAGFGRNRTGVSNGDAGFQLSSITSGAVAVAAGNDQTVVLMDDGSVWTAGYSGQGELGQGTTGNTTSEFQITNITTGAIDVEAGFYHTAVLKSDGSVWTTGSNTYGQLGLGDTNNVNFFTKSNITSGATAISAGCYTTIALKDDGSVWGTGYNEHGELGTGDMQPVYEFTESTITSDAVDISGGYYNTSVLKSDGSVWVTGYDYHGALGLGDFNVAISTFTETPLSSGVKSLSTGTYGVLALKYDGTVWTTGTDRYGMMGLGNDNGAKFMSYFELTDIAPETTTNLNNVTINGNYIFNAKYKTDNASFGVVSQVENPTDGVVVFSVAGRGMDNTEPSDGDIRYVPASWEVKQSGTFGENNYVARFSTRQYTLALTYNKEQYDGTQWIDVQEPASENIVFGVQNAERSADGEIQMGSGLTNVISSTEPSNNSNGSGITVLAGVEEVKTSDMNIYAWVYIMLFTLCLMVFVFVRKKQLRKI